MDQADKSLTCMDCGAPFVFTVQEQKEHEAKNLKNEPKRCPECRKLRRMPPGKRRKILAQKGIVGKTPAAPRTRRTSRPPRSGGPRSGGGPGGGQESPGGARSSLGPGQGSPGRPSPGPPKRFFAVVCAECGLKTRVPFEPRPGRPVYCGDCYRRMNPGPRP
jgi:CxxC-x17-CxxC domain-containing protein